MYTHITHTPSGTSSAGNCDNLGSMTLELDPSMTYHIVLILVATVTAMDK